MMTLLQTWEGTEIRKHIVLIVTAIMFIQPLIALDGDSCRFGEVNLVRGVSSVSQDAILVNAIEISSNSGFSDSGFSGEGTESDPYILEFVRINATQNAIRITDTSAHFVIENCILEAEFIALYLFNVSNGVIESCEIFASVMGINAISCEYIIIRDCDISRADSGIMADAFNFGSIEGCTLRHNGFGINFLEGNNTQIVYCTFIANPEYGLRLAENSRNLTIFQNDFGWNGERLLGDLLLERNARDDGINNTWISNRFSDFDSLPYIIDGGNSRDLSASLLLDITFPSVTSPEDIRYDEGETGNWLSWNATDEFPSEFRLVIDNIVVIADYWLRETYNISVDGMALGSHNITIQFIDASGNSMSDEVWVSVMISVFGGEGTELVLYASIASIVSVSVLIVLIKKMK